MFVLSPELLANVQAYAQEHDLEDPTAVEKLVAFSLSVMRSQRQPDRRVALAFDDGVQVGASLVAQFASRIATVMGADLPAEPPARSLGNGRKLELVSNA